MKKYLRMGTVLTYDRGFVEESPIRVGISRRAFLYSLRTQIGRSMVEMLAVLAIIGILSIGSIAGYNYAINKNHANNLLDEASKMALSANLQLQMGKHPAEVDLSDFDTSPFGNVRFSNELTLLDDPVGLGIRVDGVDQAVCKALGGMNGGRISVAKWDDDALITLTPEDCEENNNALAFIVGDAAYAYGANGYVAEGEGVGGGGNGNQGGSGNNAGEGNNDNQNNPPAQTCADICTAGYCDDENCVTCPDDCISSASGKRFLARRGAR